MNERLRLRLEAARERLRSDPEGPIAGDLPPGYHGSLEGFHPAYADFLRVCDGGRFGEIDLWAGDELGGNQYLVSSIPGGASRWLVIGQVLYQPLALERSTSQLTLFDTEGLEARALGDLDKFLEGLLSAQGYLAVTQAEEPDEWSRLLADDA